MLLFISIKLSHFILDVAVFLSVYTFIKIGYNIMLVYYWKIEKLISLNRKGKGYD